ncbi:MAG: M1 family metallopeptidase, partial [Deltaproteobacteria bacterium]|nr:M1 family metallopeptidase [Deltaproteobacteria bacterium]
MDVVSPINYRIVLEPDLEAFRFSGVTEILLEALEPVSEVILNALDLSVASCKVDLEGRFLDCPFSMDCKKETLRVTLPEEMEGRFTLTIDYGGSIGEGMKGLYRSKYEQDGVVKYLAVTQFQERDARRAFPCFDHPQKKAVFDIELIIDDDLTAISNGQIVEERRVGNGKKSIRFGQTPRMSTYLVCFAIGRFEFVEDPGDVLVRAATTPGMAKYAGFGLEFGRKSLEFCEDYYGIKYPLEKLDLIAIGDFAAGAMENWGAITFRENLLLHYPEVTSKAGEQRICEVIAHEMAHQWFGNLVSPSDWKYLWLNESFATYFGYGVVDHYFPQWDMKGQFLEDEVAAALERDALHETIPIEIPGGEHVVINASTAPIIYSKGGSILRQVEGHIGADAFKGGLRRYLEKHAYGCASSRHLWEALEEASDTPVIEMMKSWIEQPGHPVVAATRNGNKLVLNQKRFTYLQNESKQTWLVPIAVKVFYEGGHSKTMTTLLAGQRTTIDLGEGALAYKVNDRQTGFYRVHYREQTNLQALGEKVLNKVLPQDDRWGLQNDLYGLVKNGSFIMDEYLDFLSYYENEDAFLPMTSIASNLLHAYMVMDGPTRDRIASTGRSLFEKVLLHIGFEPNPSEGHTTAMLRDQIMFRAVLFGSMEVEAFALERFSSCMEGERVHPDIMKSVMQTGALHGRAEVFDWFDKRLGAVQSEHERMILLTAIASFKGGNLIKVVQQYALDEVPDRNKFIPISCLAANPYAAPHMWEWFVSHIDALEQLHPMHYERV